MPFVGLNKGYILLDSATADVLRAVHEFGQLRHNDFMAITDRGASQLSMAVMRLHRVGMLFKWPPPSGHKYDGVKAQDWWHNRPYQGRRPITPPVLSSRERTANMRARQKEMAGRTRSVFDWRP